MQDDEILAGKRMLIVDDEPDVLETLEEMFTKCLIDKAPNFEAGKKLLERNTYDVAIFDIMGVKGYELLRLANQKSIPALMLTAHALSPENLIRSIREGAQAYVPKDQLSELPSFVRDIIELHQRMAEKRGSWFVKLRPFFDKHFGEGWREKDEEFWKDFESRHTISKRDLEEMM
jgi:DNA-binding response OmpR family regulator